MYTITIKSKIRSITWNTLLDFSLIKNAGKIVEHNIIHICHENKTLGS